MWSMNVHKRYLFLQDMDVSGDEEPCDEMIEYVSPEQLGEQLVTLSLLPESRWKNLLNLDIIKVLKLCKKQHTSIYLPYFYKMHET